MAQRENQSYIIFLIIAVMLVVVLSVLAFWGFSSASQFETKAADLQAKLTKEETVRRSAEAAVQAMEIMIGQGQGENLDQVVGTISDTEIAKSVEEVRKLYDADLRLFSSTTPDAANRSWHGLVEDVLGKLNQANLLLATAQDTVKQTNLERDTEVKKANSRVTTLQGELDSLNSKLMAVESQLEVARAEFNTNLSTAEQAHREGIANFSTEISTLKDIRDNLAKDIESKQALLANREDQLREFQRKKFPVADGRIVEISNANSKVFINLGFEDGLYRRINFSVFGRGVELEAGLEKATIEVTRIVGPHQAEALITSMNSRDPILPNDHIVTASWDPGYEVPIAITGLIDLDDDGESDLNRLKGFIQQNHGKLVAVTDEEGNIEGKIDLDTRYLVVGKQPEGDKQQKAFSEMDRAADKYGATKISVREFLHLNGFHPEASIQSLDTSTRTVEGFEPRRPPIRESAFDQ